MKNNRGFLLAEETLKIIIAVICIGFLAYFLISVYMKSKTDENLEFARASLEHLMKEADSIKNGEMRNVEIWNPKDWVVVSWPHLSEQSWGNKYLFGMFGDAGGINVNPLSCSNLGWENCLCICNGKNYEDCDKEGICFQNDFKVDGNSIKIENLPLQLKIENGVISK